MNQIMSWFTDKLAPGMQKIFSNPWVGAVASAMQKILPFILVGSVSRTDFPYCISDGPLPDNGNAGEEYSDRENRINDYRY